MVMRQCLYSLAAAVTLIAGDESPAPIQPQVLARPASDGRVAVVYLAPKYATAIRMHEPVNAVVIGDPTSFSAEHSEREPNLVFVKPLTTKAAQTNLLVSTVRGHQASLLLVSRGEPKDTAAPTVDFVLRYKPAGRFLVEPADYPSAMVAETARVSAFPAPTVLPVSTGVTPSSAARRAEEARSALDELLDRQRKAELPVLFGGKPGISDPGEELVKAGTGEVIDQGREVVVLFSVVNPQKHSIELMPPQIQLGGKTKSGWVFKKSRWTTAEQFPIGDYRLSRRRIGPGERADGVVVFQRPPFKQSNETLFLQIAESGAVDRPALAPIGFGISSFQFTEEAGHGAR